MTLTNLKETARTLFLAGVRAADPTPAVKRALDARPLAPLASGRLIIIAFGKAAGAMMQQALQHVPAGQAYEAIAVTNYENAREIEGCRVMASGHPLPDQNGIDAGIAVMGLLEATTAQDQVLCLISGGGSALLPTPRDGLTLAEKIKVNETLLEGGLDIIQMNKIRQRLSVLKGGGLLDMAHPATVRSLIISDVVGDDLASIASGPTAPSVEESDPVLLLKNKDLWDRLPTAAQLLLNKPKVTSKHPTDNTLVCTNQQSLAAIAKEAPAWTVEIRPAPLTGDVSDAAQKIVNHIKSAPQLESQLIIWGGETTVEIKGKGQGGRNQELAVRVAQLAQDLPGKWVFLSGGTDGRDGPTDAAGGIVDEGTLARSQANGVDVSAALQNNDSYRILQAAGDLLMTGATGTNVADIQLFFRIA